MTVKIAKWLFYLLFIFGMIIACVYFLFPSQRVAEYIDHQLRASRPELSLTVGRIKPWFPPGLRFQAIQLYNDTLPLAQSDRLEVFPQLLTLHRPVVRMNFRADAYDGNIEGTFDVNRKRPADDYTAKAVLSGIRVRKVQALESMLTHKISGVLSGRIDYESSAGIPKSADLNLTVDDSAVTLTPPLLTLKELPLGRIGIRARLTPDGTVIVEKATVTGSQLDAEVSGRIRLQTPLERSVLNLTGTLKPHPTLLSKLGSFAALLTRGRQSGEGILFTISGTLEKPGFRPR